MNDRLQAIKEHVKRGLVIADIGCDHAFLLQKGHYIKQKKILLKLA